MAERKKPTRLTPKVEQNRGPAVAQGHTHQQPAHDHTHDHTHDHSHTHGDESKPAEKAVQTVTIEDAGPARKKLTIELPAERIEKKLSEAYDRIQNDASLPGFRPGRAPMRLIQKRFSTSIRDDVRTQLLSEAYTQAIQDEKIEVLGEPDVKDLDKLKLPDSGPMSFVVEVEVSPKFDLPAFDGLEVKKPKFAVTDDDVAKETKALTLRMGTLKTITDAPAQAGDYITADLVIRAGHDDKPDAEEILHDPKAMIFFPGQEQEFKGNIAGIAVDDLGHKLADKKISDTVALQITGPANHEDERIKDKPVTLALKVEAINRQEPAAIAEVVKMAGVESEDQLKDRLQQMLQGRQDRQREAAMHNQVCEWLLDKVTLELPEGLTGRQTARLLRRRAMELAYQGVPEAQITQQIAELRATSEEEARKQLKLFFLLDQAANDFKIEVSENEVNGRIAMIAMQQGRRLEKMRSPMQRSGELESLFLSIREQKTLDAILAKAKVTEVEPAELESADKEDKPAKGKGKSNKPKNTDETKKD